MFRRALGVEAVEDGFEIVWRNARSFVLDGDPRHPTMCVCVKAHSSAWRAERDRIVDEIVNDLTQPLVTSDHLGTGRQVERQRDLDAPRDLGELIDLDDRLEEVTDIHRLARLAAELGVEARSI